MRGGQQKVTVEHVHVHTGGQPDPCSKVLDLGAEAGGGVQAKRAANAVARQVRLRGSAAVLTGPPLRRPRQPHEPDACEKPTPPGI
jgi:hypothetical protein